MSQNSRNEQLPAEIDQLFQEALASSGNRYLARENELVKRGEAAVAYLRAREANAPSQFEKFTARTLAAWIANRPPEFLEAMKQISEAEKRLKTTPAGAPRADIVETILVNAADGKILDYMALRVAMNSLSPDWLEAGALRYVVEHGNARQVPALEYYIQHARNPQFGGYATEALPRVRERR
jgi:hypothetical protein